MQSQHRDAWPWFVLGAWAVGCGATGWTAWRRWSRFRRLTVHAIPAPPEWQALSARIGCELGLRRPPELLIMPGRMPPLVVPGWRRPRVLVPAALLNRFSNSQKEALLLHEFVHIQHFDHLMRVLELVVSVAYWWLPVVKTIGRQLRACEEACCDAAVVARRPIARRDYALLLLDVLDFACPPGGQAAPQATAISAATHLEERLRAILDARPARERPRSAGLVSIRSLALCLACAVLPIGLHFDFQRWSAAAPAAMLVAPEPAAGESCAPADVPKLDRSLTMCCPS